ncbi:hypothetical protein [Burkholderia sp. IMCC1007]|uniref:hypothetical protein n=1 Tax=Burkholderia sp. IMCC1007 TaxID=3004104 RepID=UPI0022B389A0|nr:hypothetical protein [Burkholderia sp. IMCC1007]
MLAVNVHENRRRLCTSRRNRMSARIAGAVAGPCLGIEGWAALEYAVAFVIVFLQMVADRFSAVVPARTAG